MASAGFVHPGTGSHTERLHPGQCEVSLITRQRSPSLHVVLFVFFFCPSQISQLPSLGRVSGKRTSTRKDRESSEKRGHDQEQAGPGRPCAGTMERVSIVGSLSAFLTQQACRVTALG